MKKSFLLLGGFDCTGGAGILADFRVANFLGLNPYLITTVTAIQNASKGFGSFPLPLEVLKLSLDAVFTESEIEFCKIGMVGTLEIAEFLANYLSERNVKIILDTPLKASSGFVLQSLKDIKPLIFKSFLVTPNKAEFGEMEDALKGFNVLIKSFFEKENEIFDKLIFENEEFIFSSTKIDLPFNVRGTGCSLATAICCFLFLGESLINAVQKARILLFNGIKNAKFEGKTGFLFF